MEKGREERRGKRTEERGDGKSGVRGRRGGKEEYEREGKKYDVNGIESR